MTESQHSSVTDEDGETVEVYDGEPESVDRDKGGVQDIVEADEVTEDGDSA